MPMNRETPESPLRQSGDLVLVAYLIALGVALHALEALVFPVVSPVRLGLANIVVVLAVIRYGVAVAGRVAVGRVLVSSLVWGTLLQPAFFLALAGAVLAWAAMSLAHGFFPRMLSEIGLSLLGAVFHLFGQCLVLVLYTPIPMAPLVPYLLLAGLFSGCIVGAAAAATARHLPAEAAHAEAGTG